MLKLARLGVKQLELKNMRIAKKIKTVDDVDKLRIKGKDGEHVEYGVRGGSLKPDASVMEQMYKLACERLVFLYQKRTDAGFAYRAVVIRKLSIDLTPFDW